MLSQLRCPDGTFSIAQSTTIFDCTRVGNSVTTAISTEFFLEDEAGLRDRLARFIVTDPDYTCRPFEEPCASNLASTDAPTDTEARRLLKADVRAEPQWHPADVKRGGMGEDLRQRRKLQAQSLTNTMYDGLYLTPPPEQITFKLPAFMLARMEFDFTQIPTAMAYDDHWRVAVFVDGHKHVVPYPASFWFDPPTGGTRPLYPEYREHRWSKSTRMALHLHSMRDLLFRVELQILHGLYTDQITLFVNSLFLSIKPEAGVFRADPTQLGVDGSKERMAFVAAFEKTGRFALGLNMPRLVPNDKHYPTPYAPWRADFGGAILEYSRVNVSSGVLIDPIDGELSVSYSDDDFWTSALSIAPMSYFPYFSHCTSGVRIGLPPSGEAGSRNYAKDVNTPFAIGQIDSKGGAPSRRRGNRMKCNCGGQIRFESDACGPCSAVSDPYSGDPARAIDIRTIELSGLPPGSNEYHFLPTDDLPDDPAVPAFIISSQCGACAGAGHAPGDAFPSMHKTDEGKTLRVSGWDSHAPIFHVLENPLACNVVPAAETIAISEWDWLATKRYSDACDYVMQCMFEENTLLAQNKPFWFDPIDEDILFWITRKPIYVAQVSSGFGFPDLEAGQDDELRSVLEAQHKKSKYFSAVKSLMRNEDFMFVRADIAGAVDGGLAGWYPLRLQLDIKYWQKADKTKQMVHCWLRFREFHRPDITLRGHEYDLRITFTPSDWLTVLDAFGLSDSTYLLFYAAIDILLILVTMILWGLVRISARQTAPPRLHFWEWLKGFELNPLRGFCIIAAPIMSGCTFIRMVMGDMDVLSQFEGDMRYVGQVDGNILIIWRHGRVGICILALGFFLMRDGSALLCPRKDMPGSIWKPGYWQRRHVMYTSIFLFVILLLALEFSFSTLFKLYPLAFMLAFKIVWMQMETWLLQTLTEKLVALPFECALQTVQYVMTLGADGFLTFIQANILEAGVMIVKRVTLDPVRFRLLRLLRFRINVQLAQRAGSPVPVMTPELEAIGIMTDMLSLMYRYSVDTLGSVISPITIAVLFLFREEFEINKLYGMRSTDLRYFMLFSFFLIPAFWVIDIFLFNMEELLYSWKLFEYIQFCNERFRNRSRRWIGLDNTINEELPADLRALDQMCLSVQFFMLGSLHACGIVLAVLGYMLVLHKNHNIFGDPMVIPIFSAFLVAYSIGKKVVFRMADRWQVWMVDGEDDHDEVYDEGPGSRHAGALPAGMAAVDAGIAECIEDAFAAGYSEDHLVKLLFEAASYIPPGVSIQAQGSTGTEVASALSVGCPLRACAEQVSGVGSTPSRAPFSSPPHGCHLQSNELSWSRHREAGMSDTQVLPQPRGPLLAAYAPPPPRAVLSDSVQHAPPEESQIFSKFVSLFRKEMRLARENDHRLTRFVPSVASLAARAAEPAGVAEHYGADEKSDDDDDGYDFWPDFGLGIALDDGQEGGSETTTSTTEGSTPPTEWETGGDDDSQDDLWPIELLATST